MATRLFCLLIVFFFATAATAEVVDITAIINTAQETHTVTGVPASAGGFASLQYDDSSQELSWNIAWQDISGPAIGMHFHAPAGPGANAGVAVNIGNISGLSSPSIGSATISDDFAAQLLGGESYVNIHTDANGSGEIRGQVNPNNINLFATLDAAQEIPAPDGVPSNAGGSARLAFDPDSNLLGWNIEWENLTGSATGMHFHGPAGFGEPAGVQVNIGNISGLDSPSIGSTVISDEFESQLLSGQWYINIHTAANGPGEIRGQVVPEPTGMASLGVAVMGILAFARRWRRSS